MKNLTLIAPCKLGLEGILNQELKQLGYEGKAENGSVTFFGDASAVARSNIGLRTAERILLEMGRFAAESFDALFEGVKSIPWEEIMPEDVKIDVEVNCIRSTLFSARTGQSIVKKAIIEKLKNRYRQNWFPESGPVFKILVVLTGEEALIALDTSGAGLHKRGYRQYAGEAPLRETIAAALVMLSGWKPETPLFDPFCGSGTIPIEAAMIGKNQAPGLKRPFLAETWPFLDKKIWKESREEALSKIKTLSAVIRGSDIDGSVISVASDNSKKAGVGDIVTFERMEFKDFRPEGEKGMVICNPPYGERLEDVKAAEVIYKSMGRVLTPQKNWSWFVLSPHPDFEKIFGRKSKKNRKIYNGPIRCYFYSL